MTMPGMGFGPYARRRPSVERTEGFSVADRAERRSDVDDRERAFKMQGRIPI
jgi:hypothetical protein